MTFRDDHDAAIARSNALETELERTKRELDKTKQQRDQLATEVEALEQYRPTAPQPAEPDVDHVARLPFYWLAVLVTVVTIVVVSLRC